MDGLFTVFGLGTAFGVFCSWMYDVIRKRNLPVSRGASFEAFHGADVMPAPEPVVASRPSEPVLNPERDPVEPAKPVDLSLIGPYGPSDTKAPARIDPLPPLPSVAPLAPLHGLRAASVAPVALSPAVEAFMAAPKMSPAASVVAPKPAAPVVNSPVVNVQATPVAPMKETVVLEKTLAPKVDTEAKPVLDTLDTLRVEKTFESKATESKEPEALVPAADVVFTQAEPGPDDMDLNFDVADVSFVDTISFDPADFELPTEPRAPRVVLLVNNTVVRDVQENDLLGLMLEFGILADSSEADLFKGGEAVTVGRNSVQLVQA